MAPEEFGSKIEERQQKNSCVGRLYKSSGLKLGKRDPGESQGPRALGS